MGRNAKVSGSKRSKSIAVLGSLPNPPAWLTGRGLEEWFRVRDLLQTRGILSGEDWMMLNLYGSAVSLIDRAWQAVAEVGLTITTPNGMEQTHPAITIAKQQADILIKVASRLGLSPSDRQGMRIESPTETSDPATLRFFAGPQSN